MKDTSNSREDKIFHFVSYTILSVIFLIVAYPLYFVVIASFSDPMKIYSGEIITHIKGFTLIGYERIFQDPIILSGYKNAFFYMVGGTFLNVCVTIPAAYALSRKDLKGRKVLTLIFVLTMFFQGGLIPTYLLVKNLNLYNTVWIMLIFHMVIVYNLIVAKTFFQNTIPDELYEAASIDGCSNINFFLMVVLPLSKAIIAIMTLYYGVMHWNDYFTALIYLKDEQLYPLQLILRKILINSRMAAQMIDDDELLVKQQMIAESIKYGVIIVASVPVLIMFPFVQKYFQKGVMIGSVKG